MTKGYEKQYIHVGGYPFHPSHPPPPTIFFFLIWSYNEDEVKQKVPLQTIEVDLGATL